MGSKINVSLDTLNQSNQMFYWSYSRWRSPEFNEIVKKKATVLILHVGTNSSPNEASPSL